MSNETEHTHLDRNTLIDLISVAELMLLKGKGAALGQHLAFIKDWLEVDLGLAQMVYAKEQGVSPEYLCQ